MATDPYKYFRVEARELLEQLSQGALDLEKGSAPDDLLARLLRVAHTLKGAARVVKQPQIGEHAHQLEDLFSALRDRTERASREEIDRVLALIDDIGTRLAALTPDHEPRARASRKNEQEAIPVLRPDLEDVETLVRGIAEAQTHVAALQSQLDDVARIGHLMELIEDQLGGLKARATTVASERQGVEKAASMVDEARGRLGALQRHTAYGVDQIDRELRHVGDAAARLRLVPASALLRFLERAARDVAQAVGKTVRFEGHGGDLRVHSDILTNVQSALLQLVRNAVAHGIESSHERRAAGKSSDGRVMVTVSRRGTSMVFACSDDGTGIDFAALRRVLQQKGAQTTGYQALDDDALLRLLLKGGISTAGTISDVAGRGIGLDIVREAAERLGGRVSLHSEPGKGTTVELLVPSSLGSFPALLVETAGVVAAIPLDAVRETIRVTPATVADTAQGRSIVLGAKSLRLLSLDRIVHSAKRGNTLRAPTSAIVIESDTRAAAFTVDRVLGTANVVMQPLPPLAPAAPSIAGASLDVGGEPRLVLDPASLIAEAEHVRAAPDHAAAVRHSILVVDDSLTTRMLEQSILESAGYDVSLASSGEEGLEKARASRYALFLVDVEMPGMDGFMFIEHVRADPDLRGTPSILVTSRASAEDRQRGREVGAQGYIVKSDFDQSALLEQIRVLVQ